MKWITYNEYPPLNEPFIAYIKDRRCHRVAVCCLSINDDIIIDLYENQAYGFSNLIAWMTLPKPPKL